MAHPSLPDVRFQRLLGNKEIKEFLGKYKAKEISISESLDSAHITLTNGAEMDEAVENLNNENLKDNAVVVKASPNPKLLCIAHIPLSYTDDQFKELCGKHGDIDHAFIMKCEGNGESKGYGFVEFSGELEQAKNIKSELDWFSEEEQLLHVDFLDDSCQTWSDLSSRCILITNMPEDFTDVSILREMFGCVTSPVYCQIIAKGDKSLGYGIVEFRTAEDAEQTWLKLRDEKIKDKDVVLTFCIPGKSAVTINNRIMWKLGDKLQKNSSLLPDPLSAKPVIAGNPIVISLSQLNPKLMDDFTIVLGELQQAYVSQMMSPINKPGLLGPAPSLPLSPMMNPNMQLGLLVMLALHIQRAKKEQFAGVLAKQLNVLNEHDASADLKTGSKPSILGDPMTGQANVILASLKQQLNQVPLTDEDGKEMEEPSELEDLLKYIVKKFVANGRYLNLSLLGNLGQLLVTMKQADIGGAMASRPGVKGQSLLGPVPVQPLMSTPLVGPASGPKGHSLLGDSPMLGGGTLPLTPPTNSKMNQSVMQAMGLNLGGGGGIGGSGGNMNNVGQSLLSQISQGLVHQIGQNLLYQMNNQPSGSGSGGRGLLGDMPKDGPSGGIGGGSPLMRGGKMGSLMGNPPVGPTAGLMGSGPKSSLLGEPPLPTPQPSRPQPSSMGQSFKSGMMGGSNVPLDQGSWKSMDNRKRVDMGMMDNKNRAERWGSGAYESGYSNKSSMGPGGGYNDYGYGYGGGDSYMDPGSGGNFSGGYGDGNDYYNSYQQQYGYGGLADNVYQTDGGYNYQFGQGYGMGGGGGGYGMGSGGIGGGSQASGVNFQDGQTFGKGGSGGLGQDNSKFGSDGFGGMSGSMGGGMVSGMGGSMGSGMGGGMGNGMGSGMGGGMGGGMGNGMGGGMGSGMGGGMGGGMNEGIGGGMGGSMGSGMGGGMGNGMGGVMGSNYGYGSRDDMGNGYDSYSGGGSYSTGMGDGLLGNGMGGRGISGSMMDNFSSSSSYGTGRAGGPMRGSASGPSSLMGGGGRTGSFGSSMSSGAGMTGKMGGLGSSMAARDPSAYFTSSGSSGSSGLLPSPSKYMTPAGQKRSHSQLLPQPEPSPDQIDYIGQHSQGIGGHYMDSYKRSRLF
ncbi:ribonucleoprotein PTB-binding 2 [Elysia marginata]|uniref:Ribonucleoprotein PTB-binding 2 n=1 Tax=Elysia marginata TaxID=1093978 RepID=A0AAV4IM83_9GAST|nr:ribonucleoprotein PTB-binding 2 [Elysia marginata]